MNSYKPVRAFAGLTQAGTTGRIGLVLALMVSILGLSALQSSNAAAADPTAPVKAPLISDLPFPLTTDTTAQFVFGPGTGETQDSTGYVCRLDSEVFAPCTSPVDYTNLAIGDHFFGVKATNEIGAGPEATYSWTVDGVPLDDPILTATVKPAKKTIKQSKRGTFTVSVANSGGMEATEAKACVAPTPAKFVFVKKCQILGTGTIAAGATATAKFDVKVSRKAKPGKKVALDFTITADPIDPFETPIWADAEITVKKLPVKKPKKPKKKPVKK